ncbi:MAG: YkgJ family cysteine cluster protein [Spirochaetia bacterium]|jgi:Fe-S-cluster containining protein
MATNDVRFSVLADRIELDSYTDEATLEDFVRGLEAFRISTSLKTSRCAGCGECCLQPIPVLGVDIDAIAQALETSPAEVVRDHLLLPEFHASPDERKKAIREISRSMKMPEGQAAIVYDFNNAERVILQRRGDGACCFLTNGLCTIYESRPLSCRIYLCAMGDKLSILHENIVQLGTNHLYRALGWIEEEEAVNPFVGSEGWGRVPLRACEPPDLDSAESLFFYF